MPDSMSHGEISSNPAAKINMASVSFGGSTFCQRREDIFKRLQQSAEKCKLKFSGKKELATEKDDSVAELCEALEDTFTYGLKQKHSVVTLTAVSLFQNMHEIVTGNSSAINDSNGDTTFWDFCQIHLTPHERERYTQLNHVWTKCGLGRAFIRATLNENSLQRYLLTWLAEEDLLHRYYTQWSLLLDGNASKELPQIIGSLQDVLFALTVNSTELNAPTRITPLQPNKEEPVIYAPTPVPTSLGKNKRRTQAVERPISTANSTEDLLKVIREVTKVAAEKERVDTFQAMTELPVSVEESETTPPDPIEPELAFLKEPLPDVFPPLAAQSEQHSLTTANTASIQHNCNDDKQSVNVVSEQEDEDRSDTSSQYSKSSSANCTVNHAAMEEKLREMEERCTLLETRVAQLTRDNRQLVRRLTQNFNGLAIDPTASLATNFLITIPTAELKKTKHGTSYYAYEIHITMRQNLEHWSLLRRYRDFHKLHKSLLHTHPTVSSVEFPPKKHFGNMNLAFVEERRQQLQIYLLNVVEILPQVEACKSKAELQRIFPFLRER
ncbi:PREDICTED: sorting nexin-29 [Bactrocera latifrons]|uniref:sorting nexin-29 n=1 Tax=Bactrocera latifrons TaxID=174628 RepID=UPI0008DE5C35|nr:PREDICTED: sorting nexin-29 [Bactrocera latifrons]XP_018783669.1 PREDICTED: sorting nexin-29 [Bactrocera latifrons]